MKCACILTTAWSLGTFADFHISLISGRRTLFPPVLWRVARSPPRALSLAAGPVAVVPRLPPLPLEVPYVQEAGTALSEWKPKNQPTRRVQVGNPNSLTRALNDVALLDHLPESDVAARASVEAALLVALLLNASPVPPSLAAAAALVAVGPLSPPKQRRRGEERFKCGE